MKVLIYQTQAAAADCVAGLLADRLAQQPDAVLGLATGGTMESVYDRLITRYNAGEMSMAKAQSFNLDEYVGLKPDHACSYWHYMREKLFNHVDMRPDFAFLPHGDTADATQEADRYEAAIAAAGDIDLQLLGLGANGHIGFNEPTSSLTSHTRIKTLTRSTREANARYFDAFDDVPRLAITMGIGTIMRSDEIVLLAYGEGKAEVAAKMIEGPISAACPASILQMHRKVTVVLDEAAASSLALRAYYEAVHPEVRDAVI